MRIVRKSVTYTITTEFLIEDDNGVLISRLYIQDPKQKDGALELTMSSDREIIKEEGNDVLLMFQEIEEAVANYDLDEHIFNEASQRVDNRYIVNATTKDWVGERGGDSLLVDDTAVFDNLADSVARYNSYLQDEDLYSATLSAVILSTDYPTDPSMQWLADEIISK